MNFSVCHWFIPVKTNRVCSGSVRHQRWPSSPSTVTAASWEWNLVKRWTMRPRPHTLWQSSPRSEVTSLFQFHLSCSWNNIQTLLVQYLSAAVDSFCVLSNELLLRYFCLLQLFKYMRVERCAIHFILVKYPKLQLPTADTAVSIMFHTPVLTPVDVATIACGVTLVLCCCVSSGRRREVEGEATGIDLHGHHHSQRHGCSGHASLLRRDPVFWLRLWSFCSCKSSTCCNQTLHPTNPPSLRSI